MYNRINKVMSVMIFILSLARPQSASSCQQLNVQQCDNVPFVYLDWKHLEECLHILL